MYLYSLKYFIPTLKSEYSVSLRRMRSIRYEYPFITEYHGNTSSSIFKYDDILNGNE